MISEPHWDPPAVTLNASRLYHTRVQRFTDERNQVAARSRRVANLRFLVFSVAVVAGIAAIDFSATRTILVAVTLTLMVSFVSLVIRSRGLRRELQALDAMVVVNERAKARVERHWDSLEPSIESELPLGDHPFAEDLDLFGRASLAQLLGTVHTAPGARHLGQWLCDPAPPAEIATRQQAVAELAPMFEFRQQLEIAGLQAGQVPVQTIERFLRWAESTDRVVQPAGCFLAARVVGPVLGVAAIWLFAVWLGGNPIGVLWIVPVLANALITGGYRKLIHSSFDVLSACEKAFLQYAGMLEQLDAQAFASQAMQDVVSDLRRPGVQVHQELLRLHNLTHMGDLRRSSSAYFFFQMLLLWDFHVLSGLEKWKQRSGLRARGWINALGKAEALSALAGLAHDNPDWIFPDVGPNTAAGIEAADLGHPLLREDVRVVNDVEIGPPHSFLLVTGSNMSGKSTLLRAIGVNVVLAQAGGVVCATRFRMRPARMYTSMRVGDSLERGVSYFMAGVMRLKTIVEGARAHRAGDTDFVYLLDEILQGTNTAERQIAVRNIMAELLSLDTIGAVTTHDLTLAETEELRAASRSVHFSEVVESTRLEGDAMLTFDYKLRPGIATSTNALRLLRLMGIGDRG